MEKMLFEWVEIAKEDLESAKILIESKKHVSAVSIYESHQAIEKILKAYLMYKKIEPDKTHNLITLASKLSGDSLIIGIIPKIQIIDRYYPKLRYPSGDRFTYEDALQCYNIAESVFNLILEELMK